MEAYSYSHFPAPISAVHIALFANVKNASTIRARIIQAATMQGGEGDAEREAINFAFVEAKLVASRLHLQTAIHQSMLADAQDNLKTKTVHSEIIWSLNPTNNITEALRRFGVSDTSTSLLVVRIGPPTDASVVERAMKDVIEGDLVPLENLKDITDWSSIRKYYKLNGEAAVTALQKNTAKQNIAVDEIIFGVTATNLGNQAGYAVLAPQAFKGEK